LKVHTEAEEPEHEQEHGREHGGGDSRFLSLPETRRGEDWGWSLGDFELLETLGTGTFGRVILCRIRPGSRPHRESMASVPDYCAMKVLQKSEVVRLKQVEHIGCERSILGAVAHPFIVNL
jgi:protein kinase X